MLYKQPPKIEASGAGKSSEFFLLLLLKSLHCFGGTPTNEISYHSDELNTWDSRRLDVSVPFVFLVKTLSLQLKWFLFCLLFTCSNLAISAHFPINEK